MANKKISELPLHTVPYRNDLFVIVDSTSVVTKQITLESIMASPGDIGTLNPGVGRFTTVRLPGDTEITASSSTGTLTISTTSNQLLLLGNTASILGIATGTSLKVDESNNQVLIRASNQDQVLVEDSGTTIYDKLVVSGDLFVDGTAFVVNKQEITTSDNIITLNDGEAGAGVTSGYAGLEIDRGSLTNYEIVFEESSDTFRVGESGSLQRVALIEDSPTDLYIPFWDSTANQLVTTTSPIHVSGSDIIIDGNLTADVVDISAGNRYKIDGEDLSASDIVVSQLGTPTYTTMQDLINVTQSAGKLTGGNITDNGDGTVAVSAGTGLIKTTDSDVGVTKTFDWSANSSVSLTDNSSNYIYVDYNGGSPQIVASTSLPSDKNTNVVLGLVYRDGTDLHITTAGQVITNYAQKTLWKDLEINGRFQRVNGMMLSETGTRNIAITSGTYYVGLTKVTFPGFDTSGTDTFTYYYRDGSGGWTKVTGQTQIDNLHYDDGSGTLATLSNPSGWRTYYGVHWVYADVEGEVFVVYGQGNYLLTDAQNAQPPASLPEIITSIGQVIGKIIIKKNASSFESVESAFDFCFVPTTVVEHNALTGLQGGTSDEYYHLTADEHSARWLSNDGSNTYHNNNVGIGTSTFNASLDKGLVMSLGTAPDSTAIDAVQIVTRDYATGDARLYIYGEASLTPVIIGNGQVKAESGIISRADVGDYGGGFATYTPPTGAEGMVILAIDTNASSPGKRLYAYANSAWNYVNLT